MYDSTACMYVTLEMMLYCGGYKMYSNYCACIKTVLVFMIFVRVVDVLQSKE